MATIEITRRTIQTSSIIQTTPNDFLNMSWTEIEGADSACQHNRGFSIVSVRFFPESQNHYSCISLLPLESIFLYLVVDLLVVLLFSFFVVFRFCHLSVAILLK